MNILGLRRSLCIANMKRKQLDPTLNYVSFTKINKALGEDTVDLMKETFVFKEVIASLYKM